MHVCASKIKHTPEKGEHGSFMGHGHCSLWVSSSHISSGQGPTSHVRTQRKWAGMCYGSVFVLQVVPKLPQGRSFCCI